MNALRAHDPDASPPVPSQWTRVAAPKLAATEAATIVPSTSRLSGKVRGLVERHPEETLSVLRRWMEESARGG